MNSMVVQITRNADIPRINNKNSVGDKMKTVVAL